ncbi:hypothetical protein [Mycolicibacterium fortuitum]|uniref:Uncharacterized protein n=2 Tax=Mycolicibacterium fortuitum TaxID=1766 RepID=A0AAE4VL52_MYCFO|nr:hypothetical protein [Mycolicibacterium fortuitum]MCV7137572.1 hypothetical protein [Mycolicibacterium fortuitum]MDV7195654.1 hypothetical protein [Mycolicibacterium fortuitum]MDV7209329.1 hypothetical protein [Mycolicibacterium fortuitum]MDV7231167.1 hypothetical protein [Mycolicibacterium fortuitum]MDV7262748.1 hypothetical protein [Mycolicibacterium fortuitum]
MDYRAENADPADAEYRVEWTIDIEAASPEQAARQALVIQRGPDSIATVFEVRRLHRDEKGRRQLGQPTTIDLTD